MNVARLALDREQMLELYGELAVKIGLNLRAGQRLLIIGPLASGGVSLDAAPLVRPIAASAYRAGAPLVGAERGAEPRDLVRFGVAQHTSFNEYSASCTRSPGDPLATSD